MEDLARISNGTAKPQASEDAKFKEVFLSSAYDESSFIGKFVQ